MRRLNVIPPRASLAYMPLTLWKTSSHHASEIKRNESAEKSQQNGRWHALNGKCVFETEVEFRTCARKNVHHYGSGDARNKQGNERSHREVYHKHLESKDNACNRGFEYSGNCAACSGTEENHYGFVVELEKLPEV